MISARRKYDTAEKRWAGVGPYYAMFPVDFADSIIQQYTNAGDVVLDPFAGRGTSIYSAAIQGRIGIGTELNPVGWVYGKAKLFPAARRDVEIKIEEIASLSEKYASDARKLPVFFQHCFSFQTKRFLLAARDNLDWRHRCVDWTTMALLLVNLHGKRDDSFSNQMRQTKSMAPQYAVNWWNERQMKPPEIDPVEFMHRRINWRYAKGHPQNTKSQIYLGDSNLLLTKINRTMKNGCLEYASLLFTSPPYCGVTNYHYDQWLRLWMLGFPPNPISNHGKHKGRFQNTDDYVNLLISVFSKASKLLKDDAVVYIRTDRRDFTFNETKKILKEVFPNKHMTIKQQPFQQPTQTHLFGDRTTKVGEIDIILKP